MKVCFYTITRGNQAKAQPIKNALNAEITDIGKYISMPSNGSRVEIGEAAGNAALRSVKILNKLKPDVFVIIGDRFECLPVVMSAYYLGIPIAHVEGGEVSGSIDEGIRHAISKLASVHFCCTDNARKRLIQMGEHPSTVFNVGATSLDYGFDTEKKGDHFVVIFHSDANSDEDVQEVIDAVSEFGNEKAWICPNVDIGYNKILTTIDENVVGMTGDLPIKSYGNLVGTSLCIIGNSSSGIRESSFFGTPSVNIGSRQNGRDRAENVIDVPCRKDLIVSAIKKQLRHGRYEPSNLYGSDNSGRKIADILTSYNFEVQKVFYENNRDCACKGWKQGDNKQEYKKAWPETVIPVGCGHGYKITATKQDCHINRH
jgi:UDP-hydrolysing UDP-N-acetyl-D-glucosamine 2-epimerase